MLFYPERHEPLSRIPWDETAARDAIAEIVIDTEARFDAAQFWPAHPREDGSGGLKGLWRGAAGVIWALQDLTECGAASRRFDLADAIDRVRRKFGAEEERQYSGSFLMGEVGVLLVDWRVRRERAAADRLFKLIEDNAEQSTDELMWGAPGTALAASFMWEASKEERWRTVLRQESRRTVVAMEISARTRLPSLDTTPLSARAPHLSRPSARLLWQRLRDDACGLDAYRAAAGGAIRSDRAGYREDCAR